MKTNITCDMENMKLTVDGKQYKIQPIIPNAKPEIKLFDFVYTERSGMGIVIPCNNEDSNKPEKFVLYQSGGFDWLECILIDITKIWDGDEVVSFNQCKYTNPTWKALE